MKTAKPYEIPKKTVVEAYKLVKANKGAAGVDGVTIETFEKDLKNNLYKIWNRMSSGSYFPPPVLVVEIPKSNGKTRKLGIPTVGDRVAQMIAKLYLEPKLDSLFHEDSYGYRPNKSAIEAVGRARERCWKYDWVLDLDIKGFFDNIDHELMLKAVRHHISEKWLLLYIERWLKAPPQIAEGKLLEKERGTAQGGVISPLIANLFLHYAFDMWMKRNYPHIPFERYADDIIVHCKTEIEAKQLKEAISKRLAQCKLELSEEKTRIVYCKDEKRKENYTHEQFDFLGYTFRPRLVKAKTGKIFVGFNPAVSNKAKKRLKAKLREMRIQRMARSEINRLAEIMNPILQGWINYFSNFTKSEMHSTLYHVNMVLVRWAKRKYKNLHSSLVQAVRWLGEIAERQPELFAHWKIGIKPAAER